MEDNKIELEINPDIDSKPEYINGKNYFHKLNCFIYDLKCNIANINYICFLRNDGVEIKSFNYDIVAEKHPDGFHYFEVENIHQILNQYNAINEDFFVEIKIGDKTIKSILPTNILYTYTRRIDISN